MVKDDNKRRLRRKNIALAVLIIGLCAVFYFTTIVRIGGTL